MKRVGIVMGGDSDLPVLRKTTNMLSKFVIPCESSLLNGIDALLSTVQMSSDIPVATVAVNGGMNAALLSA